jgi:hypothetical protein
MSFIEITTEQWNVFRNTRELGLFETVSIIAQRGLEITPYTHRCMHIGIDHFEVVSIKMR